MSKNFYIEEFSGDFDDYDYYLNADVENGALPSLALFSTTSVSISAMC